MRIHLRRRHVSSAVLCGLVIAFTNAGFVAQAKEFHWLGDFGGDVTNPDNWLEQPDPDTGSLPGPMDQLVLRWGDRPSVPLEYGGADATHEHLLFNHADNGGGSTINGSGTLTFTRSGGPTNVDIKSIETQGGHRTSTVNATIISQGMIEARNGHDLVFNGNVTVTTVHAYIDDDQMTTSDVVFNGPITHTGYNEAKFMTGTGTVTFNNEVTLDHQVQNSGFGIRNGMTAILGPSFTATRLLPGGGGGLGLDTVDMYNNSGFRLDGDFLIGNDTDLFSRFGDGQNNTNKLDLNGHSDHVEFLGTHPGATFVIDFGATTGANVFQWETTHHHFGFYDVVNFEVGVDTLTLGGAGSPWWTELDTETDGDATNGRPNILDKFAAMTINGVDYAPFDAGRTTPYWTIVDPSVSRNVEFFNFVEADADFDGDNDVDGNDFLIWQRNVGVGTTQSQGDANGDNTVNIADLDLWRDAFGQTGAAPVAGAVPEPSTFALLGLAFAAMARRSRTS
jgi:hypothetical protein